MTVRSGTVNVSTIIIRTNHVPVVSPYQLPRVGDAGDKHADATVLDTATVTGTQVGVAPTGTVTYTFTGTNGTSLTGLTVPAGWTVSADRLSWSETVTMSAGAVPDSSAVTALPPGSYGFVAQSSGDANYFGATSALEPLTIKWGTGAIIEPPHTTCAQVRYDLAHESTGRSNVTVRAHVSSGKIKHPVTPPFLKYFVRLFAPSSSFQIDVNQASPYPLPALAAVPGHVTLHNANARLIGLPRGAVTITPTDVKINVNKLTPGSAYYIGIRYNTKKLVGAPWPFGNDATVQDIFKTTLSAGGTVPNSTVALPLHGVGTPSARFASVDAPGSRTGGARAHVPHVTTAPHNAVTPGEARATRSPIQVPASRDLAVVDQAVAEMTIARHSASLAK